MNDEYTIIRDFPNGLRAGVERMTFGNHRIVIGYVFNWEAGYERAFWYSNEEAAVAALKSWSGEGEPNGWYRDPMTGRRRPDSDEAREYVSP